MDARKEQLSKSFSSIGSFLISIVFGIVAGGVVLSLSGFNSLLAFRDLFQGSLGDIYGISETLISTTPLLLSGLAVGIAFQGSLFNIGVEGQLVIGALIASLAGVLFEGLPSWLIIPLCLVMGSLGGALWAYLPGYLKAKRGAHEVITTIMMNYIAFRFTEHMVKPHGPFNGGDTLTASPMIAAEAFFPRLAPGTRLNVGILIAFAAAFVIWVVLWRTRLGYRIRVVGENIEAAEYAGINVPKHIILTMLISGALAGLAGAIEIIGVHHRFYAAFSPGYGLDGIAIALAGQLHPLGITAAAFVFGVLRAGSVLMQAQSQIPADIIGIISGFITLAIAAKYYLSLLFNKLRIWTRRVNHGTD